MLKLFTKERAFILSNETLLLSALIHQDDETNTTIDPEIQKLCRENVEFVSNIKECDYCVLPYVITDFVDAIYKAFYKLAMKHKKVLVCFGKIDGDVPINVKMINNSDVKQTIDQLRNVTWKIINVYKCHIPGKKNDFINDDYDIDTYCFFKKLLGKKFASLKRVQNDEVSDIVFSSVYGLQSPSPAARCKIFYNGESKSTRIFYSNVDRILREYDYYIGSDVPTNERMFRLPYWMTMFNFDDGAYSAFANETTFEAHDKTLDCAMIATTDFNSLRSSFVVKCFERGIKIHCPSKICKNTNMPVGREGEDNMHFFYGKLAYLRPFKVEICFENTHERGYVTEKIFGALMTGCIPVYWGSSFEGLIEDDIINMERVLYLKQDISNFDEIIDEIKRLTTDQLYFESFFNKPIFKPKARDVVEQCIEELTAFLNV